jgi:exopolysaccharide production protein ExoY
VTPLGRILRKTSLDELPQLFNVLRGDMSCVGPRPIVAAELERYGSRAGDYLKVRPGLTGLWQVSGRSQLDYSERVKLDCIYVRRWSLGLDIALLLRTIQQCSRSTRQPN